jgi:hypothetical protein
MYNKIPDEIKPTKTSAKITYASSFDLEFCLLLRERRSTSLVHMQDAALEVESNIVACDKLRGKSDRDRRKSITEASNYDSHTVHPQVEELTKFVKSLSIEIEKLKLEGKQTYRNTQNTDNKGNFRRPNNAPQILPRDPRNRERNDQRVQAPLQKLKLEGKQTYRNTQNTDNKGNFRRPNNAPQILPRDPRNRERNDQRVVDEEGEEVEVDHEIHCLGDTSPSPHLTQSTYEQSLMDIQINELSKGEKSK